MENPLSDKDVEEVTSFSVAGKYVGWTMLGVLCLALDDLNPVKVFCEYTDWIFGVRERHVAILAACILLWIGSQQKRRIVYHSVRLFFRCTFNNMFFRSVDIVGLENMPTRGPVILTGNHNNQFVDGVLLLTNTNREISFMIAQKSWDRPFVGFCAKAFSCIPVSRPQDVAFTGQGKVFADNSDVLRGEGTHFTTELEMGAQLEIKGNGKPLKIQEIRSDTEVQVDRLVDAKEEGGEKYKVLPKLDQSKMYDSVYRALRKGKCLGIFPEGGSHDRTDLLPLKAGVAIIALDAHLKHNVQVPIVPVGLNYFKGHRFGGRVVVEFGTPIHITETILAQAETDKRGATEAVLQMVTTGMRSVIVPTPDYSWLQQIYMVRRLYMREGVPVSTARAMDLNRRFAVGIHRMLLMASGCGDQAVPTSPGGSLHVEQSEETKLKPDEEAEFFEIKKDLEDYMANLKALGLRDHQVRQIGWWSLKDLFSQVIYLLVTVGLGAIPNVLFNWPVMAISSRLAVIEQDKSLKASSVKLAARDVVMSFKIIYVLVLIPMMYVVYGSLLVAFTPWCKKTIILVLLSLPFSAFLGTKAAEQGVRTYADVVPLFYRLLPGKSQKYEVLPQKRAALARRLRLAVRTLGPRLGELCNAKEVDWSKEMSIGSPSLNPNNSFGDMMGRMLSSSNLAEKVAQAEDGAQEDNSSRRRRKIEEPEKS